DERKEECEAVQLLAELELRCERIQCDEVVRPPDHDRTALHRLVTGGSGRAVSGTGAQKQRAGKRKTQPRTTHRGPLSSMSGRATNIRPARSRIKTGVPPGSRVRRDGAAARGHRQPRPPRAARPRARAAPATAPRPGS